MPDEIEWIDAHHHLWDLSRVDYPWLQARGEVRFFGQPDPIRKDYLVDDYRADIQGRISRSIHVQVGARPGHELLETEFIADCSVASGGHLPAGAVAAVDLGRSGIEGDLDLQKGFPVVRGVRHMIGKSPEENPTLPKFRPAIWVENWRLVAERGLSFDLQLTEDQFDGVYHALVQVPDLRVALCHLASPWDRTQAGFIRWKDWMRRFAQLPNLSLKISGWCMFAKTWDEDEFLKWASASVEIFGADRCMLGSNFPVDSLYLEFGQLFSAWEKLVMECSEDEGRLLAGRSAANFYRI